MQWNFPAAPGTALEEPTCETIGKAQKLQDQGEQNWALSQACGFYRLRCPEAERDRGRCVRVMGESCSALVLRCSLLSAIRSLELLPSPQPGMKGEHPIICLPFCHPAPCDLSYDFLFAYLVCSIVSPLLTHPSLDVSIRVLWAPGPIGPKRHPPTLEDRGWQVGHPRELALAGEPAVGWGVYVWGGVGGQCLGGDGRPLLLGVSWTSKKFNTPSSRNIFNRMAQLQKKEASYSWSTQCSMSEFY